MRLTADPTAVAWLRRLRGASEDFDWDAGNRSKSRKHGVETDDVESIFYSQTVFLGRVVEPAHEEDRWLLLGQDRRDRRLALIFTRRGDRIWPISGRPMRRGERIVYEEALNR
jgi:uncharacterized DUF497 family protein